MKDKKILVNMFWPNGGIRFFFFCIIFDRCFWLKLYLYFSVLLSSVFVFFSL